MKLKPISELSLQQQLPVRGSAVVHWSAPDAPLPGCTGVSAPKNTEKLFFSRVSLFPLRTFVRWLTSAPGRGGCFAWWVWWLLRLVGCGICRLCSSRLGRRVEVGLRSKTTYPPFHEPLNLPFRIPLNIMGWMQGLRYVWNAYTTYQSLHQLQHSVRNAAARSRGRR